MDNLKTETAATPYLKAYILLTQKVMIHIKIQPSKC